MDDQDVDHPREVNHLRLLDDVTKELAKEIITETGDVRTWIIQDVEQRIQELGKMSDHLGVRDAVKKTDPGDQELSDEPIACVHSLSQHRYEGHHIKLLALGDNVLEESVQELGAVLDVLVRVGDNTGDGGEDVGEHGEDMIPGNLDQSEISIECVNQSELTLTTLYRLSHA